jgi:hypothetical protein
MSDNAGKASDEQTLKGNNLTGFEDMLVPGLKYNMTEEVIGDYRD